MSFTGRISKIILTMMGWKIVGEKPNIKKFVFIAAPHTSNWDFPIGRLSTSVLGINLKVLMKKSWFFFPLGYIFRWLGAMPVDRSKSGTVIDHIVSLFKEQEEFVFAITLRGHVPMWNPGRQAFIPLLKKPMYLLF